MPVTKGRGALDNPHNRYAPLRVESCEASDGDDLDPSSPVTECRPVRARSIIASNASPDVPFERSINPYQGCEHGCIYCYARPSHAYLDLSPGVDFETRLTYKENAAQQLELELCRSRYRCQPITLGANTDPYQPVERRYRITRQVLEVLQRCRHPVSLITKGNLVTRDIDILADLAADGLCSVAISVTTLDAQLKRKLEPRAASGKARLGAMQALAEAGVPVTLLFAPVIPALNDHEMERIVGAAADQGAVDAAYILLRLPLEIGGMFQDWLQAHYPMRADHVMSLVRQCRDGNTNDSRFGYRMRGTGQFADLLNQRFKLACRKAGLRSREGPRLRTDLFSPQLLSQHSGQMTLFT
ncbi:MAG: PA0069 family radical SAM protein [Halioglobus sp.]|nr:PA0069 family radical SAM protein [Halioglobus sp.]